MAAFQSIWSIMSGEPPPGQIGAFQTHPRAYGTGLTADGRSAVLYPGEGRAPREDYILYNNGQAQSAHHVSHLAQDPRMAGGHHSPVSQNQSIFSSAAGGGGGGGLVETLLRAGLSIGGAFLGQQVGGGRGQQLATAAGASIPSLLFGDNLGTVGLRTAAGFGGGHIGNFENASWERAVITGASSSVGYDVAAPIAGGLLQTAGNLLSGIFNTVGGILSGNRVDPQGYSPQNTVITSSAHDNGGYNASVMGPTAHALTFGV